MQILTDPRASEAQIEDYVCLWAEQRGFLTPKVKFAEKGWPDRLFISPFGHTIFIEFKRLGGEPDKLQEYRLKELTKRGIPAFCCDSIVSAINILKASLEPASVSGAGDKVASVSSISRTIFRSGSGEDQHSPGSPKNPESERLIGPLPDNSAPPGDERSVAPGDREVGRFPGDDVDNPPWSEKAAEDIFPDRHTPDKP